MEASSSTTPIGRVALNMAATTACVGVSAALSWVMLASKPHHPPASEGDVNGKAVTSTTSSSPSSPSSPSIASQQVGSWTAEMLDHHGVTAFPKLLQALQTFHKLSAFTDDPPAALICLDELVTTLVKLLSMQALLHNATSHSTMHSVDRNMPVAKAKIERRLHRLQKYLLPYVDNEEVFSLVADLARFVTTFMATQRHHISDLQRTLGEASPRPPPLAHHRDALLRHTEAASSDKRLNATFRKAPETLRCFLAMRQFLLTVDKAPQAIAYLGYLAHQAAHLCRRSVLSSRQVQSLNCKLQHGMNAVRMLLLRESELEAAPAATTWDQMCRSVYESLPTPTAATAAATSPGPGE